MMMNEGQLMNAVTFSYFKQSILVPSWDYAPTDYVGSFMYIPTTRRWFYLSLGNWGLAGRMSYRYESDIMQTGRNNVVM